MDGSSENVKITRTGIFYDGSYFAHISNHYRHEHEAGSRLDVRGLHKFTRECVADACGGVCKIVEAHYFRGRFPPNGVNRLHLYRERQFEDALMKSNVTTHFLPVMDPDNGGREKGIDVWFALETYDVACQGKLDAAVLVAGDSDYVSLLRKLHAKGVATFVLAWNLNGTKTSRILMEEACHAVDMAAAIDEMFEKGDTGIFLPHKSDKRPVMRGNKQEGVVASLPYGKDFGFLSSGDDEGNLFFHKTWVIGDVRFNQMVEGDAVEFVPSANPNDGRPTAIDVEVIQPKDDDDGEIEDVEDAPAPQGELEKALADELEAEDEVAERDEMLLLASADDLRKMVVALDFAHEQVAADLSRDDMTALLGDVPLETLKEFSVDE